MAEKQYLSERKYFPNLDGLRFIGSLIIIIFHVENIKFLHNRPVIFIIKSYSPIGNFDVSLFFVLSGFLITYLLLKEKKEKGSINLKAYYARRTLRIWPLYYLIVIVGFFVLPSLDAYFNNSYSSNVYAHFWPYFIGSLLFLSPIVARKNGLSQGIAPIWSIGVEEAFYLCWPLFLQKTKKYLMLFIAVVIFIVALRNGLFISHDIFDSNEFFNTYFRFARYIIMEYRISCMAIGAIGAYLVVFEKNKILSILYRKDVQWSVYIVTINLLLLRVGLKSFGKEDFPSVFYEMYSVLFAIMIVNLATNPKSILRLDYKWMTYLGRVSYGLYMYHPIMRIFSMELTEHVFKREISGWQMNVCLYFLTIASTILISIISYEFFEKRFLNLKKKFAS
jgi:peptidoglycan/LPS O-acetylase OafA/YrhL